MTTEYALVNRIRHALKKRGVETIKLHISAYSQVGDPDIIGCYRGKWIGLEVKVKRNQPSQIQAYRHEAWRKAGGKVAVVRSIEESLAVIDEIDKELGDASNAQVTVE